MFYNNIDVGEQHSASINSAGGDDELLSNKHSINITRPSWQNSLESLLDSSLRQLDNESLQNVIHHGTPHSCKAVASPSSTSPTDTIHLKLPSTSSSSEGRSTAPESKSSSLGSSQGRVCSNGKFQSKNAKQYSNVFYKLYFQMKCEILILSFKY